MDLSNAILSDHARQQLAARQLCEADLRQVLAEPDQVQPLRPGRVVAQKLLAMGSPPQSYLIRVFVDVDRHPPQVVTAYRTSKIHKYRSRP